MCCKLDCLRGLRSRRGKHAGPSLGMGLEQQMSYTMCEIEP